MAMTRKLHTLGGWWSESLGTRSVKHRRYKKINKPQQQQQSCCVWRWRCLGIWVIRQRQHTCGKSTVTVLCSGPSALVACACARRSSGSHSMDWSWSWSAFLSALRCLALTCKEKRRPRGEVSVQWSSTRFCPGNSIAAIILRRVKYLKTC